MLIIFFFIDDDDGCTMDMTSWFGYKKSKCGAGQDLSAPSYPLCFFLKNFLCICSLVLTSKFGYKRQSMRSRLGSLLSFLWSWRSCCAEYSWTRVQLKLDCLGSEAISKFLYGLGEVVVWWIIKLCIHN